MPLRSWLTNDSDARAVSRLISRCASHWITSASTTTNRTWSSRCTGPARKSLVSEAARPSCETFHTRRHASPGSVPQLPVSVSGVWFAHEHRQVH